MDAGVLNKGCMYDDVFRRIFANPNKLERAADLISAILELPVEGVNDLVLLNDELAPDLHGGKSCRLDLFIRFNGRLVNVELQHGHSAGYFKRNFFMLTRIISTYAKSGDLYQFIPVVNMINIIDFSFERIRREMGGNFTQDQMGPNDTLLTCGGRAYRCSAYPLSNPRDEAFHKTISVCAGEMLRQPPHSRCFHYLELGNVPRITGNAEAVSRKEWWLNFLKIRSVEDLDKMYKVEDKLRRDALEELRSTMSDERYAFNLLAIEKAELEAEHAILNAEARGEERGLACGEARGEARGRSRIVGLVLATHVPDCPAYFLEKVNASFDAVWLDRVAQLALNCHCWEELREKMI